MISDVVSGIRIRMSNTEKGKPVNVKHFPSLNIQKWIAWGLPVSKVLRTPRYNFIIQPTESRIFRHGDEDDGYICTGIWYRVDESQERLIEKASWIGYVVFALLFGIMLRLIWIGSNIWAVLAFLLMYAIVEGFTPVMLAWAGSGTRSSEVVIPYRQIENVALISDPGVLLISWKDDDIKTGLALGFTREKAKMEFEELKGKTGEHVVFKVYDKRMLGSPPK